MSETDDPHAFQPACPKAGYLHGCRCCKVEGCDDPPEQHPADD